MLIILKTPCSTILVDYFCYLDFHFILKCCLSTNSFSTKTLFLFHSTTIWRHSATAQQFTLHSLFSMISFMLSVKRHALEWVKQKNILRTSYPLTFYDYKRRRYCFFILMYFYINFVHDSISDLISVMQRRKGNKKSNERREKRVNLISLSLRSNVQCSFAHSFR